MKEITSFSGWTVLFITLLLACNVRAAGVAMPAAPAFEGTKWQLVEVNGAPVSPLAGEKQPHIMFDPALKKVTGFAGCNNFSGGYERHGSSLKFGPVGSTRMSCPDLEMSLETEVFKALDKTRTWEIKDGRLLLLADSVVLARFTTARGDAAAVDLESMTFLSKWFPSGKATLSHGEYRKPAAPGSASETVVKLSDKRVFGLINGKETGAVVLVTDPGGSGTFHDLALLTKEAAGWVNTDTVLLGDRVKVQSIEVTADTIVIKMKTHGSGDPMCCPSAAAVKRFTVKGNRLVSVADETPQKHIQGITGTVWQWVQTQYSDDRKAVPADPKNYTVRFREDGALSVKADCNQKGGTYSASTKERRVSIEITHSTMAACPEGSLEDEFVRGLTAAALYFIKDDNLYMDLKYDSGTMRFSKQKEK
jgi:heat shock protein HslJ